MSETLAAMHERMERRYWADLLLRLPMLQAAARVADISVMQARRHLEALTIDFRAPPAANPPMEKHEVGLTLRAYLDMHERWYWQRLLGCRNDRGGRSRRPVVHAEPIAGINSQTIYYRLKRLGIKPWRQSAGNDSWQALGA